MKFSQEFCLLLVVTYNVIQTEALFENLADKVISAKKEQALTFFKAVAKKIADRWDVDLENINLKNLTQVFSFYKDFSSAFHKNYTDDNDRKMHFGFFRSTIQRIREHNAKKSKYKMGVNELSDLSIKEIEKQKTGLKSEVDENGDVMVRASAPLPPVENMPTEWDWRKYGILTPPRNQGKCGSCWSFAAAAVLESHNMKRLIAEGKFVINKTEQITVSEQNLIDCSAEKFGSIGCDGGMPQQAWKYVAANGGVNGVDLYPYKGKKENCAYDAGKKVDVVVSEAKRLKTGQDEDLATAIFNYGPVAIAVHVTKDMTSYKSGIFDDPNCSAKKVNHAVVAVGYTPEYFIIRNSWGPKWGEEGYIKISRSKVNNCGVSQQGYYPIIPNAVDTEKIRNKFP